MDHLSSILPTETRPLLTVTVGVNSTAAGLRVRVSSSTSGLYALSISKVSGLSTPLPPISEQHAIIRRVDAEVAAAREKTEAELARREGRAYEPASVLLERIHSGKKEKTGRRGTQSTLV